MYGASLQKLALTLINVHTVMLNDVLYCTFSFCEPLIMEKQILAIISRFKVLLESLAAE